MTNDFIMVQGAKEKNLKNISISIPKNKITSVVGVSGSGKSALVFDTIAAESQRQLNETYSSFIRSRLPHYGKPTVDSIQNLPVSIIINQKRLGENVRSTVGTVTDIYSLLRLLFSRIGTPFVGYSDIFSFNNPQGMCKECQGLGTVQDFQIEKLLDKEKSLNEGAIQFPTFYPGGFRWKRYVTTGLFDNDKKIKDYTEQELDILLYQSGFKPQNPTKDWPPTSLYEGIIPRMKKAFLSKKCRESEQYRSDIERVVTEQVCPSCHGNRLNKKTLNCRINGKNIADCSNMSISDLVRFLKTIQSNKIDTVIDALLQQLSFAIDVGLGYLTLNRKTATLSGGESQRIKMIRQLGSSLNGLLYIFDEPSTGLHPADIARINPLFKKLRDKGNSVLIVEHDPDVTCISDYIIEMGVSSGKNGGNVTFKGTYQEFCSSTALSAQAFTKRHQLKENVRTARGWFHIEKAHLYNLQYIDADVPKSAMTIVTGVAGSGKSTLFQRIFPSIYPECGVVTQKAITTNRRSNISTFITVFDDIRDLFSKANKVDSAWFSFNSKGACPNCKGLGIVELDLAFMESVTEICEVCSGKRFSQPVLEYTYHGKNINDVLNMSIEDALAFFEVQNIQDKLVPLCKVGLEYLSLGQPLNTLSGGELQRLKLAVELKEPKPVYVLDEPTTGLHSKDIQKLIKVFDELIEHGSTLIVIEHNLEMMCQADWIIDLGPGAGKEGGQLLFQGMPKDFLKCKKSVTTKHLQNFIKTNE